MEKDFTKFLTIGEVSRLKNVSIKSLRYYDSIDVFKPSYTNLETGYRYYTLEQLPMLNIISFCLEIGISLKNWNQYLDENNDFRLDRLLVDARELATEKLNFIRSGLSHIERTQKKMSTLNIYAGDLNPYSKLISERNFLFVPTDGRPDKKDFLRYLSILHNMIDTLHLDSAAYYPAGILMDYTPFERNYSIFIEIDDAVPSSLNYRYINAGNYLCYRFDDSKVHDAHTIHPEYFHRFSSGTVIETDLINHTLQCNSPILEIQFLE